MILKVKNLVKNYYKDNEKIEAVNNISYNFEKGKFYAIMGPSGSGKSTFLHLIGTLDTYDEGSVFINNIDVSSLDDLQLSKIRKEEIGFVFQSFYLNNNMKAYENVIMPIMLDKIPYKDKKEKGITILNSLGLEKRVNHYPSELSKGECQRVAIARALINNPNIILADEPTGNLDSKNERNIFELLKKLSLEGKCVIVVSHNEEIKKYADVVLKIRDGKLYE
ncbi:MAG: ABC transporter ATP-binding protein [Mycoplasma sp.]|jgi:putative ABC transport system ATP-binding protein|nr:ABC transporter ATP-binding protein [Mycoplasma sp.]MDD7150024.1 ABC transporter ATP-binding protein [Mycoplasma sp.]MDY4543808.1 ABC transporter ATP-binding protein [Bacilli bacterium]MDY4619259.1 ABC transporter ATP-binding protein [Bacilli bacterium]